MVKIIWSCTLMCSIFLASFAQDSDKSIDIDTTILRSTANRLSGVDSLRVYEDDIRSSETFEAKLYLVAGMLKVNGKINLYDTDFDISEIELFNMVDTISISDQIMYDDQNFWNTGKANPSLVMYRYFIRTKMNTGAINVISDVPFRSFLNGDFITYYLNRVSNEKLNKTLSDLFRDSKSFEKNWSNLKPEIEMYLKNNNNFSPLQNFIFQEYLNYYNQVKDDLYTRNIKAYERFNTNLQNYLRLNNPIDAVCRFENHISEFTCDKHYVNCAILGLNGKIKNYYSIWKKKKRYKIKNIKIQNKYLLDQVSNYELESIKFYNFEIQKTSVIKREDLKCLDYLFLIQHIGKKEKKFYQI